MTQTGFLFVSKMDLGVLSDLVHEPFPTETNMPLKLIKPKIKS